MPAKSPAQARLMNAVAHNPKFAKKVGIPVAVGKEFSGPIKHPAKVVAILRGKDAKC